MTQIFLIYIQEDEECGAQLRHDLEAQGYSVYHGVDPTNSPMFTSASVDRSIRGSTAIVLVWSKSAARSGWVEHHILLAQRLQKRIVPLVTDGMDLPITLVNVVPIIATPPCVNVVEQILPQLPPPTDDNLLNTLLLQSSHEYIRERKAAIQQAAELLERGEHREPILAVLEDIARNDLMQGVREMAQAVLDAEATRQQPMIRPSPEPRHVFGVRCPSGHVTYFDKREVCPSSGMVVRNVVERTDLRLDELYLKCKACGADVTPRVDCEGYK